MHEIKLKKKKVNKTLSTGSTLQNYHLLQLEMDMTLFIQYCLYVLGSIHHFHIDHNAPCLPLYRHRNDPHHRNDPRQRNDPQSPPK